MYKLELIDEYINTAREIGDKETLINLIKAKNAMVLHNLIKSSSSNVKLGWRGKGNPLSLDDIKVEF